MKDKHDMIQIVRERLRVFLQNNLGQVEYLRTDVKDRDYIHETGETTTHVIADYAHMTVGFCAAFAKMDGKMVLPLYNPEIYADVDAPDMVHGSGHGGEVRVGGKRKPSDKDLGSRIDALIEEHLGDELRKMFVAVNPDWKPPTNE